MQVSLYHMTDEFLAAIRSMEAMEDLDPQTFADTLEGLSGELAVKQQNVAGYTLALDADIDTMKAAEQRIAARRKSLELRRDKLRQYLLFNMQRASITEIKAIDGSFRVRVMQGRESVQIDAPDAIPADYMRVKTTTEPDKTLIAQSIKDGYEVPGCRLERKPTLKID